MATVSGHIRMQPVHFLELQNIWEKDKRFPTVSSRNAWAHARNLDPDAVSRRWYRRRSALKLCGLTANNEQYELPIGTPPVLEDDKSLVLKKEKQPAKGKKRKVVVIVPDEEKENAVVPEAKPKKARTAKGKKKATSSLAMKQEQVESVLSSIDINYADSSSTVVPSSSPSRCSISSLPTSSSPVCAERRAYSPLPPSSPPPDSDTPPRFPSPASVLAFSPDLAEYFAELYAYMNSVYVVPEHDSEDYRYCQQGLITALGSYTCCLCTAIPTANHDLNWSASSDSSPTDAVFLPPVPSPTPAPSEQSTPSTPAPHHRESSPQHDTSSSTIAPSSSPPSSPSLYDRYKIQVPYEPYHGTPRPASPPPSYCLFGSRYRASDGAYVGQCSCCDGDDGESRCKDCLIA